MAQIPTGGPGLKRLATGVPFPTALFVVVLLTDVTYWRTADPLWSTMSSWLLLAGLVIAGAAVLGELIGVLGGHGLGRGWMRLMGDGLAMLLSAVNFVFHVRDGFSAVAPAGPLLSATVVLILVFTGCMGLRPRARRVEEV